MGQRQTCNSYLLAYPFIVAIGRWREHHTLAVHCYCIIHAYSLRFGSLTSHVVRYGNLFLTVHTQFERNISLGGNVGERYHHGRLHIKFVFTQSVLMLVINIGMHTLHHFLHQFLGTELQDLVCHIHLVHKVLIAVETCRRSLVGGVLDDNRGLTEIHKWRAGILVPSQTAEYYYGQQEPVPFGQEIEEQVFYINLLIVLVWFAHLIINNNVL